MDSTAPGVWACGKRGAGLGDPPGCGWIHLPGGEALTRPPSSPPGLLPTGSVHWDRGPGSCGSAPMAPRARPPPPHLPQASPRQVARQVAKSVWPGAPGALGAQALGAGPGLGPPGLPLLQHPASSWPKIQKG